MAKKPKRERKPIVDAKRLGQILHEEFERDSWGTIEPFWLQDPPRKTGPLPDGGDEMRGLWEVLDRTARRIELVAAHRASSLHREQVGASEKCGCFRCLRTFGPDEVREWTDGGLTALCPFCGIDAVLPDIAGFPLSKPFLREMAGYWFSGQGREAGG